MKKIVLALVLVSGLVACANQQPAMPLQLDYAQLGKINLDVQSIDVLDPSGNEPTHPPFVGFMFHPTVAETINSWVASRLQAVGASGKVAVIIKDASVTADVLPTEHGFNGWFKRQQATRYTARANVVIDARTSNGIAAYAAAEATYGVTLPENPTDAERQNAYISMLEGLMRELDHNLDQSIHQHMPMFVLMAPPVMEYAPAVVPNSTPNSGPAILAPTQQEDLTPQLMPHQP